MTWIVAGFLTAIVIEMVIRVLSNHEYDTNEDSDKRSRRKKRK